MNLLWVGTAARALLLGASPFLSGASLDGAAVSPESLLAGQANFSPAERADIERGRIVAEVLESADRTEVISVAALRVRASAARLLVCARDPACLRGSDDLLEGGVLGAGSELADLAGLSLDPRHLKAIRDCRIGACEVRLSGDAIQRFRHEVDWRAPRHAEQAADLFRQILAALASGYRAGGNAGLPLYRDKAAPSSVAASLEELLGRRFFPLEHAPDLVEGLASFPRFVPPRSEQVVAWTKERFWRKVLVSLHHVTLADRSEPGEEQVLVTSKQIYASHYFESSVEVTLFVRRAGDGEGAS